MVTRVESPGSRSVILGEDTAGVIRTVGLSSDGDILIQLSDLIASASIAGKTHQLIKVEFGGDGKATAVSAADPLPVHDNMLCDKFDELLHEFRVMNAHMVEITGETFSDLEIMR